MVVCSSGFKVGLMRPLNSTGNGGVFEWFKTIEGGEDRAGISKTGRESLWGGVTIERGEDRAGISLGCSNYRKRRRPGGNLFGVE